MQSIGPYIQKLQLEKGSSSQEIASTLDLSRSQWENIVKGRRQITREQLYKLSVYFNQHVKDLLIYYQYGRLLSEIRDKNDLHIKQFGGAIQFPLGTRSIASSKRLQNMLEYLNKLHESKLTIIPHRPSPLLSQYIDAIAYCSGHNLDYPFERIMPDGTVQMLIKLDDGERAILSDAAIRQMKKVWVSGIQRKQHVYRLGGNETIVYIRFRSGGFHALTQIPQWKLENKIIDAELLFGNSVLRLREELQDCPSVSEIFMKIEQFFLKRRSGQPDLASQIVGYVSNHIDNPLSTLIKKTGYSQKHLIQMFKEHIGVTPKYFQRIHRFNQVLNDLQMTVVDEIDWSTIVYKNRFYDQSHLIKEFNHFANTQPKAFLDSAPTCTTFLHSKTPY